MLVPREPSGPAVPRPGEGGGGLPTFWSRRPGYEAGCAPSMAHAGAGSHQGQRTRGESRPAPRLGGTGARERFTTSFWILLPSPATPATPPPRGGSLRPCLPQKPVSRVQAAVSPASPRGHRRSPQTPSSCPPPALEEGRWASAEPSARSQQAEQILGVLWVGRRDAATFGCPGPGPAVTGLGGSWEGGGWSQVDVRDVCGRAGGLAGRVGSSLGGAVFLLALGSLLQALG